MDKIQEEIAIMRKKYKQICEIAAEASTEQEVSQAVDAFIDEYGTDDLGSCLLIDILRMSNAGRAARLMLALWLSGDDAFEMCEYLLENEDATEGQILWKCRQILGRE